MEELRVNEEARNWGAQGVQGWREQLDCLSRDGQWDVALGDLVLPALAHTTNRNILVYHAEPGIGLSPITVAKASDLGGVAHTEVPHPCLEQDYRTG